MQKYSTGILRQLKNTGSLIVQQVKNKFLKPPLEYCRTFLDIQAKIKVDKIMDVIQDPEAASRIIQYFESQHIYIKSILKDKKLIKKLMNV